MTGHALDELTTDLQDGTVDAAVLRKELARVVAHINSLLGGAQTQLRPIAQELTTSEVGKIIKQIRQVLSFRRTREKILGRALFADPAWDMLLDLYSAHLQQQRVSVSSVCVAANVPSTTALRWLGTLLQAGLVSKQADPLDARRIFVVLTSKGLSKMDALFGRASEGFHPAHCEAA